ncbi:GTP 3',8-cyclase [Vibrio stylophorae]|uniref:GTP 3',8-cyclase n=1 Tax=Vibrio stylophorae TaxID=659351 RepID=A0ABM8ZSM7_9VIBR|nr:GTP 3',8-cyclase MoaA [Vibrio stylophorae]CAH0533316.1 GTP 3',8-cyclase [Vibrio stylophorae]
MAQQFEDRFHRKFYYLRLSVTDVCNFKCTYCLPHGYRPTNKPSTFLSLPEIERVIAAFSDCGTDKIRITGGEPSMRRDLPEIIHAAANRVSEVAMTTNGYRMARDVATWREAGLTRINVSVDSLDPRQFAQITGENRFAQVMAGIDQAFAVGFEQIKVNSVLLKDLNSQDLPKFLAWIKDRPIQLRFIELMQTGEMDSLFTKHHQSGVSIRNQLMAQGWQLKARKANDGPAQVFTHPDYLGEIGLIMPYEKGFCASCNRLRISALGKLHLCLFGDQGIDLRDYLQADNQKPELIEQIQQALQSKAQGHYLHLGDSGATPHLASIGG